MKINKKSIAGILLDACISPKVTLGLFALLTLFLVPTTFSAGIGAILLVPARVILVLVGLNLTVCTLRRYGALKRSTLLIHCGVVVILAGGMLSTFGFLATVNVYEGSATDTVYDWGAGKDVNLGLHLRVRRIHIDFYPTPVKVGILNQGRKADLVQTRTGDSFDFSGYRINVVELDPVSRDLQLDILDPAGSSIGSINTAGRKNLPEGFPLDFKLVAFRDPRVKRMWVDLELIRETKLVASGSAAINAPLRWHGMQFFLTGLDADASGNRYAGIQISKDPGLPLVYGGCLVLLAGILVALGKWFLLRDREGY